MRHYHIDELSPDDVHKFRHALEERELQGSVEDVYFLPVPKKLLTGTQQEHGECCGPHVMPLETGETWIKLELLVRGRGVLRCECFAFADAELRNHMIGYLDDLLAELEIVA